MIKIFKKSSKALKKNNFIVVYWNVNKTVCSIQHFILQILTVSGREMQDTSEGTDVNWCVKVSDQGIPMQHRLYAQHWADGSNMFELSLDS